MHVRETQTNLKANVVGIFGGGGAARKTVRIWETAEIPRGTAHKSYRVLYTYINSTLEYFKYIYVIDGGYCILVREGTNIRI